MRQSNVIYSRSISNNELAIESIKHRAPAAFTSFADEHVSSSYALFNTSEAFPIMADYGYYPVQAMQKRIRKGSPLHTQHMVSFAHQSTLSLPHNAERPEIILYNSHDGKSSFKLFAGFYRFICSNGIIAGNGFEAIVRHTANHKLDFEASLIDSINHIPKLLSTIDRMKQVRLSHDQTKALAHAALSTRWDSLPIDDQLKPGVYFDPISINSVLKPIRVDDQYHDAWTIFNRVQESIVRGNAVIASITKDKRNPDSLKAQYKRAQAIKSVASLVQVNRKLWDLTESVTFA